MAKGDGPDRRVKTTDTLFEIIEALQSLNGATLAELADELEFAKSTIHSHLATLEHNEYVVRTGDEYELGLKFLEHGMFVKNNRELARLAKPVLEDLADATGEVAWLIVEEHGTAVYLEKAMGERAVQTHASVGGRARLHHLATGKLILAYLPEERVDEIIDRHGLPERTPHTITDPEELRAELEAIREDGIAINDKETVAGLRAIGAPVIDDETIHGAICVSGPANRLTVERCHEEIEPLLLEATNELELKLQSPPN
ncbi:IclR family transcriptional regulator [Natronolimnohabitans innermongolicus]|uniref:IclR family transcriptional regulator n=1 Tax=Natronolimnohabitans innermongolicus JCM 12255 TaxID=1227499 RepID=L9WN94_9EURY|nr:IclR family transcriptional regulator [Natronolimnohabitans innermongolicus]ELY50929.1 IclR family transcriptional regulator [Natronolimnohabitans innermongolicus JCM 12255]